MARPGRKVRTPPKPANVIVELTPQQHLTLIQMVDNLDLKGKQAAFIVSIQEALADAVEKEDEPDADSDPGDDPALEPDPQELDPAGNKKA